MYLWSSVLRKREEGAPTLLCARRIVVCWIVSLLKHRKEGGRRLTSVATTKVFYFITRRAQLALVSILLLYSLSLSLSLSLSEFYFSIFYSLRVLYSLCSVFYSSLTYFYSHTLTFYLSHKLFTYAAN